MIKFPNKVVIGLVGPPRAGKDQVANFLKETRNFAIFAFADQLKTEFGISKEDFEKLKTKLSCEAEHIRQELWEFSAAVKKVDPLHFIRGVMNKIELSDSPSVISDVRTEDELNAILSCSAPVKKIYRVRGLEQDMANGYIIGTKLPEGILLRTSLIVNNKEGLDLFYKDLERFFLKEGLDDMLLDDKQKKGSIHES